MRRRRSQRGQEMSEYILIVVALFGLTVASWPFTSKVINALDAYFQSVYYVIQSPLP